MKKIKTIILIIAAALAAIPYSQAQDAKELIREDPSRIGNQLHHYEVPEFVDTKAPRGYKPVYVSHFGRHGSRYHTGAGTYMGVVNALHRIDEKGLLTDEGKKLMSDMDTLAACHTGMDGILTQVGAKEHRGVAERLYARCPKMFKQKGKDEVRAVSSTVLRCNLSMMNFCTALEGKAPKLQISYWSNSRTDEALTRVGSGKPSHDDPDNGLAMVDSLLHAHMDVARMSSLFFSDPAEATKLMNKQDPQKFFYDLLTAGSIEQCLDEDIPSIYHYFTIDELYNYWIPRNASTLNAHGFSYENREVLRRCGRLELTDILEKADEALLPGSRKVADFRFGHDGGVLPLVFFLGMENNQTTWKLGEESRNGWYGFQNIPMCTNVQMIFYRNRKGDVLVKFLHNERETTIKGIDPSYGPYYKWTELRPHLEKLTQIDC